MLKAERGTQLFWQSEVRNSKEIHKENRIASKIKREV